MNKKFVWQSALVLVLIIVILGAFQHSRVSLSQAHQIVNAPTILQLQVRHKTQSSSVKSVYSLASTDAQIPKETSTSRTISGTGKEQYFLTDGQLKIVEAGTTIWESPHEWHVDNVVLADSNNDGIVDINLSVWKPGNYGSSRPFWVLENDMTIKNHFFVFDLINGVMRPIWQSSNLEWPNCEFTVADIDYDGKNDLVVIEGDYGQALTCVGSNVAVWKWSGWGFSNEWRSGAGKFRNLYMADSGASAPVFIMAY